MHGAMIPSPSVERLGLVKIIFVSGKGGVGKSSVAAALALKSARSGAKTLLAELGNTSFFAIALRQAFTSTPQPWREGVDVVVWDGVSCLREYALHLLKSEALYRLFFENAVSKSLIHVAPGLSELAILGKITSGPPRNVGPKLPYDVVVVDGFASGHFLALLRAPVGFAAAVHMGPMGEQSRAMMAVLKNPEICSYHFVSLPEELPVQETFEMVQAMKELVPQQPWIVKNRWLPQDMRAAPISSSQQRDPFVVDICHRREREEHAENIFKGHPTWIAPWTLATDFEQVVLGISAQIPDVILPRGGKS